MGKLNATKVKSLKEPGKYPDGDGLYFWIRKNLRRSWLLRVQFEGRRQDLSLGSADDMSLADARRAAFKMREAIKQGGDPRAERQRKRVIPTFEEAALQVIGEREKGWRNAKTAAQWRSSLEAYAFPYIGKLRVDRITAGDIREALVSIWLEKEETARRVKQRIGNVLDWAFSMGYRETEAPMRAIAKGLPKQTYKRNHFNAMDYNDAPSFMQTLRLANDQTTGRQALQFAILCGVRSGEVRQMEWSEVDFEKRLWTLPADHTKTAEEHLVPLTEAALEILTARWDSRTNDRPLVFEGAKANRPMSDNTMRKVLRDMGLKEETVHGFRSTFRDWTAETTSTPHDVAEKALAHKIKNKVEAAYRRGDLLEKRWVLMDAWADYLTKDPAAKVIDLAARR